MQYEPIQGQGQGHEPFKVGNFAIFESCLLRHTCVHPSVHKMFLRFQWNLACR